MEEDAELTIGSGMHMRHNGKVGPITRSDEEGHQDHQSKHQPLPLWVQQSNS